MLTGIRQFLRGSDVAAIFKKEFCVPNGGILSICTFVRKRQVVLDRNAQYYTRWSTEKCHFWITSDSNKVHVYSKVWSV